MDAPAHITARSLTLVDEFGKTWLHLRGPEGSTPGKILINGSGNSQLTVEGDNTHRVLLQIHSNYGRTGALAVGISEAGMPFVSITDSSGKQCLRIEYDENRPAYVIRKFGKGHEPEERSQTFEFGAGAKKAQTGNPKDVGDKTEGE